MQNSVSAQTLPAQTLPAQAFASGQPLQHQVPVEAQATDQAEVFALLHTLLQAFNDLQLRVGQLEHTEHIRAALKPRRDLGIDY